MEIQIKDLTAHIGSKKIIEQINISVQNKEIIGVIGPNGSGKSTLLKCIYRVLSPSCGTILIDNKELHKYSTKESAKKIAVLSQHNYYNFEFTVYDMIMMGRSPHKSALEKTNKKDIEIAEKIIDLVGIRDLVERTFSTLSGGEQQRVILARALVQDTPCLILDEPTNHLDIKYQLQLMNIIKNIDKTIIAAIHDLNIAAMYCDKIYIMKNGKIAGFGTPEQILTEKNIKEIYEVNSTVFKDNNGKIRILYNE